MSPVVKRCSIGYFRFINCVEDRGPTAIFVPDSSIIIDPMFSLRDGCLLNRTESSCPYIIDSSVVPNLVIDCSFDHQVRVDSVPEFGEVPLPIATHRGST